MDALTIFFTIFWVAAGIVIFGGIGMAIYSTILQRRGLRTAEELASRHPESVERSRRTIELAQGEFEASKQRHEQVLEALARQTAVLEKILAAIEGPREGIKQP